MISRLLTVSMFFSCALFGQFKYEATGAYYDREGNTDYKYYNLGFSMTSYGDISLGGTVIKDSEFLLSLEKNTSTFKGNDYEDDQSILLKFDLWANGTFSPFLIAEKTYDYYRGIKDRSNYGLGAKWRVFGDFLSVSAAFLLESEQNMGKNRVYEYVDYGDSLGIYKYSNHPNLNPDNYQRISIRPKLKLPMGENFYFESEYYYKPAGTDVLTDWRNKFVIKTAAEWLNIEIRYNYKNDSEPAPKIFMKYYEVNGKEVFDRIASFENPGSKVLLANRPVVDRTPEQSKKDGFGDYYITNYKKNDTTLRVGISITF